LKTKFTEKALSENQKEKSKKEKKRITREKKETGE